MKIPQISRCSHQETESFNRTFYALIDVSRSAAETRAWPEAIGVIALWALLNDTGQAPAQPTMIEQVAEPRGWLRLAEVVERRYSDLDGVFSRGLIGGIDRLSLDVKKQWMFMLRQIPSASASVQGLSEWLRTSLPLRIEEFAGAGEVTPQSVADLMVELAEVKNGMSVYDPCCGSGTLLMTALEHADVKKPLSLFGQEISVVNWALTTLRVFCKKSSYAQIAQGDSLREPAFLHNGDLKRFDRVLCDSPLGFMLRGNQFGNADPYERFGDSVSGRQYIDSAFAQHAMASLKPGGKAVILLSQGFLFRSSDANTRQILLDSHQLQTVITLPAKNVISSAIEIALVVVGKNHTNGVLLIDLSNQGSQGRQIKGRAPDNKVELVREVLRNDGRTSPEYGRRVPFSEIASSEFVLLPRRYLKQADDRANSESVEDLRSEMSEMDAAAARAAERFDQVLRELQDYF